MEPVSASQTVLTVNGESRTLSEPNSVTLLEALRDRLGLTGAKYGCGEAQCGACVVLLNGTPTPACVTSLASTAGSSVLTIEGLASEGLAAGAGVGRVRETGNGPGGATGSATRVGALHPVQQAFVETGALQCGYCTPGMILAAVALLNANPHPSREEIVVAMNVHICRCGAYARIIQAVQLAAGRIAP